MMANDIRKRLEKGYKHYREGHYNKAEAIYTAVLAEHGQEPDALYLMGLSALKTEQFVKAIAFLEKATSLCPTHVEYCNNLGLAYFKARHVEQARKQFQRVVELSPDDIKRQLTLAGFYDEISETEAAFNLYEQIIKKHPTLGVTYFYYGLTLTRSGLLDKARGMFEKALANNYDPTLCYVQIAALIRFSEPQDPVILGMEALTTAGDENDKRKTGLYFALSTAYDSLGDVKRSFSYLLRANANARQGHQYDVNGDRVNYNRIKAAFNTTLFERHCNSGSADSTPIFVLGMPRSGTSLVEQILASHPEVKGAGELSDFNQCYMGTSDKLTAFTYPEGLHSVTDADLTAIGEAYIKRLRWHSASATHIIDKMPSNFLGIGMIALCLPKAKIIHVKRDPIDTCFSIFKQNFEGDQTHKYAYELSKLGEYYRLYDDLMAHWQRVLPGRILEVSYEQLVVQQEAESRRMIEHIGLPWDDACLAFYENKRSVHTASILQVRKPIYRDSVKAWQRYEKQLAPLIKALSPNET